MNADTMDIEVHFKHLSLSPFYVSIEKEFAAMLHRAASSYFLLNFLSFLKKLFEACIIN